MQRGFIFMLAALAGKFMDSAYARCGTQLRLHLADLVCRNFEETSYHRLHKAGFTPGAYIDVGAYKGDWTRLVHRQLGKRPTLMVEAQASLVPDLQVFAQQQPDVSVAHAVLAATAGQQVPFHEMGTGSSLFAEASNAPRTQTMCTTQTLDLAAAPFLPKAREIFLKIDVQGAELEVLRGAKAVLEKAVLVQLETAMLRYNQNAPLLPETVTWMAERGWFPTEISGFSRPAGQLVQIDMLFARDSSPLRPDFFRFD
jgi:FkbM family methyltransferase